MASPAIHKAQKWYRNVNWINVFGIVILPFIGIVLAFSTPLRKPTFIWAAIYYFWTGLGITAGYHRLWSHRSYTARTPLKLFLAATGGGAVQGSIIWWSRGHRGHHRWTDTVKDPYSVRKGLLYAHMGWMIIKDDPRNKGRVDISDLDEDPIVRLQHKHYGLVAIFFGIVFPAMVASYWGDWRGGAVYAGILRFFFVQQATFCVNSLAHWLGEQPFDDRNSPRDHMLTALVTLGEGYHNFHHEFPSDYRNAISWYQYDLTKWSIYVWSKLGLTYNLKKFRSNEIEKGRLQQQQKKLDTRRSRLDWGVPLEQLPVVSWNDFQLRCLNGGEALTVVGGVVHEISNFIREHPGGKSLISGAVGKDATAMFNGGVYNHSNAAHNLLSTMRVGVLLGGGEVEAWKQEIEHHDNKAQPASPLSSSSGGRPWTSLRSRTT
ncbi:acyl-CoA desaturase [Polyplosphaeria fusca]|uniref:Acyl-CoA desaturase n=1 Tax=Polyplosphaeria fusca TaxID=682080 RepID=A0A9P4V3L2_9PLEO|nr:acyl-CoA desaturase [Polyplosphaeria fusca]